MKKALLPLMIASLVPTAAFADVVVYGKAWLSFQQNDVKNASTTKSGALPVSVGDSYTEVRNNESRLGVKGSEAINDDLKAIYQYELKVGADGDAISSTNQSPIATRNIFVGLQGNFGTVKAGNFDTPLKLAQEKTDVFKDMQGDWKNVFVGETRAKNSLQYSTPAFYHVTANVDYVSAESYVQGATQNGYSASIVYDTKTFYIALANDHDITNSQNSAGNAPVGGAVGSVGKWQAIDGTKFDSSKYYTSGDIVRLVARYTVGPVVLGAMYQTYNNYLDPVTDANGNIANYVKNSGTKKNGIMVSAIYNIDPTWALKAQYGSSDQVTIGGKTASVGVDYKMSKNTKVTGYYTILKDDNVSYALDSKTKAVIGADTTKQKDDKTLGVALEFAF